MVLVLTSCKDCGVVAAFGVEKTAKKDNYKFMQNKVPLANSGKGHFSNLPFSNKLFLGDPAA